MSDTPELSMLDQFRQQHATFVQQRDQAQTNFQQLVGAIFACEQMIMKLVDAVKKPKEELSQGEGEHGDTNNESAESDTKE